MSICVESLRNERKSVDDLQLNSLRKNVGSEN